MNSHHQADTKTRGRQNLFRIFLTLFFFVAFPPLHAFAAEAYLKENAPGFIDKTRAAYGTMVNKAALLHNADPRLILSVIVVESEGNARVVSHRGAQGLMQLMPKTARAMGAKNPKEPLQNILAGTKYLKVLERDGAFDSPQEVLVAYNMGPNAAKRWLARHPSEEYGYVQNVMYVYHVLEGKELQELRLAKNISRNLASQDLFIRAQASLFVRPSTLALAALPMSIPSNRRNELKLEG